MSRNRCDGAEKPQKDAVHTSLGLGWVPLLCLLVCKCSLSFHCLHKSLLPNHFKEDSAEHIDGHWTASLLVNLHWVFHLEMPTVILVGRPALPGSHQGHYAIAIYQCSVSCIILPTVFFSKYLWVLLKLNVGVFVWLSFSFVCLFYSFLPISPVFGVLIWQ